MLCHHMSLDSEIVRMTVLDSEDCALPINQENCFWVEVVSSSKLREVAELSRLVGKAMRDSTRLAFCTATATCFKALKQGMF